MAKMDEATWLTATSCVDLRRWAERGLRRWPRKQRLFCVACCRRLGHLLTDPRSRAAIDAAEQYADGEISRAALRRAEQQAQEAYESMRRPWPGPTTWITAAYAASKAASRVRGDVFSSGPAQATCVAQEAQGWSQDEESAFQARLLRDIFGNPFRPVSFSPEWRTDTAIALASQMYELRDFGTMPILADALQDAGCDSEDILSHCRDGNQVHVRGCWVVDLVLGKV